jgi:ribosomal protein L11 methylase PrmA
MSKTPEELVEEWIRSNASYLMPMRIRDTFFAGYHSRDEEVAKLKEEIAMWKAELKEVGSE